MTGDDLTIGRTTGAMSLKDTTTVRTKILKSLKEDIESDENDT